MEQTPQLRTVYIGTHCPNNTVESFYVFSLTDTIKLGLANNIIFVPLLINDIPSAVVAKNEILNIVANQECESVVFIDHNIAWDANSLLTIVNAQHDAVALPVAKKAGSGVAFDLEIGTEIVRDDNGYIRVNYASTSMLKLSKQLVTELMDSNISVTNPSGNEVKNVFETNTQYGRYFNEGIVLCNKIRQLGHNIWLNPISTCANIAGNVFAADFAANLTATLSQPNAITPDDIKTLYS